MKKRTAALIGIAAVLLLFAGAFCGAAAAEKQELPSGGAISGDYILTEDTLYLSSPLVVIGEATIDLNGKILVAPLGNGAIIFNTNGKLTLIDSSEGKTGVILGRASPHLVLITEGSTFIMQGGTLTGAVAQGIGGGVVVFFGTFIMDGGTITKNIVGYDDVAGGGGVYVGERSTFTMNGGTISNNTVTVSGKNSGGGGVYVAGGTFTMNGGTITGNSVTAKKKYCGGGGVYVNGGTFNMSGGTISGNSADTKEEYCGGGGVYVVHSGTFTMTEGIISGNKTKVKGSTLDDYYEGGGGGVHINDKSTFTMKGGTITQNSVDAEGRGGGGGVYVIGNPENGTLSTFTMEGGTISENNTNIVDKRSVGGGGVLIRKSTFIMKGGTITKNRTDLGGGVFIRESGEMIMKDGIISENSAKSGGGGVFLYTSNKMTMDGGTIAKNQAGGRVSSSKDDHEYSGGGVGACFGSFFMNGGTISENSADKGGGVCGDSSTITMNGGTLSGNTGGGWGGGVYARDTKTYINNGIITGNQTWGVGGGIYFIDKDPNNICELFNSSVTGNSANLLGGGVVVTLEKSDSKFRILGGNMVIKDNTSGGEASNLLTNKPLELVGKLGENADIRITRVSGQAPHVGFPFGLAKADDPLGADKFKSDDDNLYGFVVGSGSEERALIWAPDPVAVLDGKDRFTTVQAAIDAVSYGQHTIKLLRNANLAAGGGTNITIPENTTITLDLAGYVLKGNGNGPVITVKPKGHLILTDSSESKKGQITGGIAENGGGVYVEERGTFTMNGGTITQNTAKNNGGGVYVHNGSFEMSGGSITQNSAMKGGGVAVTNSGVFTMIKGGTCTITENSAGIGGGGVYLDTHGTFFLNKGGSIDKNTAEAGYGGGVGVYGGGFFMDGGLIGGDSGSGNLALYGGGVYVEEGNFEMEGGCIRTNKAIEMGGGVVITTDGPETSFKMSGGVITDNTARFFNPGSGVIVAGPADEEYTIDFKMSGSARIDSSNELYLGEKTKITVPYKFTDDAAGAYDIIISPSAVPGTVIASASDADAASEAITHFKLDNDQYRLKANGKDIIVLFGGGYLVSFDSNGGTPVNAQAVMPGAKVIRPEDPTLDGYTFVDWFTDEGLTQQYDFDTPVNSDFTLHAKWDKEVTSVTVTFDANGGHFVDDGSTAKLIDSVPGTPFGKYFTRLVLSKSGYGFDSWWTTKDETGQEIKEEDTVKNQPMTIYAHWKPITYTIHFDANEGKGEMADQQADYDTEVTLNENKFTRDGYAFSGWTNPTAPEIIPDKGTVKNLTTKPGDVVTLKAIWTKLTYQVRYHADALVRTTTASAGDFLKKPDDPERKEGYSFDGWYTAASGGDKWVFADESAPTPMPAGDLDLYAQWSELPTYTVTYDGNGATGTAPVDAMSPYHEGDIVLVMDQGDLTKTGHTFSGWNTKEDGSGTAYPADGAFKITEDTILYAQWTLNTYTVTFDVQDHGTAPEDQSVKHGEKVTRPADPVAEGYTFGGWYTEASCTNAWDFNTPVTADMILYAKWTIKTTTVTLNAQGGTGGTGSITATYNAAMPQATMPAKSGYTFTGYFDAADAGTQYYNADGTSAKNWDKDSETATLYAQWTLNRHTVNFDVQDHGTAPEDQSVKHGEKVTKPSDPVAEGYSFGGWYTEASCTNAWDFNTPVTADMTLYAKWTSWTVDPIEDQPWTGSPVTPEVTVHDGDKILVKDRDYTVTYSDNTNPGTATVTVEGIGAYSGTQTVHFAIKKSIETSTISKIPDQAYTGSPITPNVTVRDGDTLLVKGLHYKVSYKNNVDMGTATVIVEGINYYFGTLEKKFEIVDPASGNNVTFEYQGASGFPCDALPEQWVVQFNTDVSLPTKDEIEFAGYTFNGWSSADLTDDDWIDAEHYKFRMPNKPVHLIGNWDRKSEFDDRVYIDKGTNIVYIYGGLDDNKNGVKAYVYAADNVDENSHPSYLAAYDTQYVPEPSASSGYTDIKPLAKFNIRAEMKDSQKSPMVNIYVGSKDNNLLQNVYLLQYNSSANGVGWSAPIKPNEGYPKHYTGDVYEYMFTIDHYNTPFALVYEKPVKKSSSSSQGTSYWATETPTATPTPTPTETPGAPEMPTVKPVTTETPAGKSPVPFAGILAGLGAAAALAARRK